MKIRKLSTSSSNNSRFTLPPQSLIGNKDLGRQCSQLLQVEPELMSRILDGERLGFYLTKNKPTVETLMVREKNETSKNTSEVAKLVGMGTPVAYGQKEPYTKFKIRHGKEIEIPRSYTRVITDKEVFDTLMLSRWEFKPKDIGEGGQSIGEELSRNLEKNIFKPEDHIVQTVSEPSLVNDEKKKTRVGKSHKRHNRKDEGINIDQHIGCPSGTEIYIELSIEKEETITVASIESLKLRKDEMELESEEDITNKLSDGALEIVTMVIVGCNTKDELSLAVTKFIAHVNKQDSSRRPFTRHKVFTVLEKCSMIVDHALASERVILTGCGHIKHHKIVLDRTNIHLHEK
ncbi:hypothetical protein R1sor_008031 [Riccia sorocarpa]|uniref:Uncharacterized protein n=1 Tax=Riccia sorocarpa TaxID=122646 RepID=A0ABD3HS74_9MARC